MCLTPDFRETDLPLLVVYKHPDLLGRLGEIKLHRRPVASYYLRPIPQHQDSKAVAQTYISLVFPINCFHGNPNVPRWLASHFHLWNTENAFVINNNVSNKRKKLGNTAHLKVECTRGITLFSQNTKERLKPLWDVWQVLRNPSISHLLPIFGYNEDTVCSVGIQSYINWQSRERITCEYRLEEDSCFHELSIYLRT